MESDLDDEIVPFDNYNHEQGKLQASVKWLITKVYGANIPDQLLDPFVRDSQGAVHLKPPAMYSLTSAELYCAAAAKIFRDSSFLNQNHQMVLTALHRSGLDALDPHTGDPISETQLSTETPFRVKGHLAVMDGLMTAHVRNSVSVQHVMQSVRKYTSVDMDREAPVDVEDALLFWINKICSAVRDNMERLQRQTGGALSECPVIPEMEDLYEDMCDGACVCTVCAFYRPEQMKAPDVPTSMLNSMDSLMTQRSVDSLKYKTYKAQRPADLLKSPTTTFGQLQDPASHTSATNPMQSYCAPANSGPSASDACVPGMPGVSASIRLGLEERKRHYATQRAQLDAQLKREREQKSKDAFFKAENMRRQMQHQQRPYMNAASPSNFGAEPSPSSVGYGRRDSSMRDELERLQHEVFELQRLQAAASQSNMFTGGGSVMNNLNGLSAGIDQSNMAQQQFAAQQHQNQFAMGMGQPQMQGVGVNMAPGLSHAMSQPAIYASPRVNVPSASGGGGMASPYSTLGRTPPHANYQAQSNYATPLHPVQIAGTTMAPGGQSFSIITPSTASGGYPSQVSPSAPPNFGGDHQNVQSFRLHSDNGPESRLDPQLELQRNLTNWGMTYKRQSGHPTPNNLRHQQMSGTMTTPRSGGGYSSRRAPRRTWDADMWQQAMSQNQGQQGGAAQNGSFDDSGFVQRKQSGGVDENEMMPGSARRQWSADVPPGLATSQHKLSSEGNNNHILQQHQEHPYQYKGEVEIAESSHPLESPQSHQSASQNPPAHTPTGSTSGGNTVKTITNVSADGFVVKMGPSDADTRTLEMQAKREQLLRNAMERQQKMALKKSEEEEKMARKKEKEEREKEQQEMRKVEKELHRQRIREQYEKRKAEQLALEKQLHGGSSLGTPGGTPGGTMQRTPHKAQGRAKSQTPGRPKSQVVASSAGAAGIKSALSQQKLAEEGGRMKSSPSDNQLAAVSGGRRGSREKISVASIQEPALKLFKKPTTKSNRAIIINALSYSIFSGAVHAEAKGKVLEELAKSQAKHFLILFRDQKCQYRAVYTWDEVGDTAHKISGMGPKQVNESEMQLMFKYDSGAKSFTKIPSKHLSATIDAFAVSDKYWVKPKVPHSGNSTARQ